MQTPLDLIRPTLPVARASVLQRQTNLKSNHDRQQNHTSIAQQAVIQITKQECGKPR